MRSLFIASVTVLVISCAHQPQVVDLRKAAVPAEPIYIVAGSMIGMAPAVGRQTYAYRCASAVPIAEHLLVTSSVAFARNYQAKQEFWQFDVYVGPEREVMLDNPVHDNQTGLVFIRTRRTYVPAKVRTDLPTPGETLAIQGFAFSKGGGGWFEPVATVAVTHAGKHPNNKYLTFEKVEPAYKMTGAGVYDVDGRLVGLMLLGDESVQIALPMSIVLDAMHRVIK